MGQGHAVVVGASMAGLAAAAELSRHFDAVTVVERDEMSDVVGARKHVPQGAHAHALLESGERVWNQWFPGFTDRLEAAGAVRCNGSDAAVFLQGGYLSRTGRPPRLVTSMTRPLLESVARAHIRTLENVVIRPQTRVGKLLASGDSITGVVLEGDEAETTSVEADFVVDCGGRASNLLKSLDDLGFPAPPTSQINAGITYATRLIERVAGDVDGMIVGILPTAPDLIGAGMFAVEDDGWLCGYLAVNGADVPRDDAGFVEFARALPRPDVANIVEKRAARSPIAVYRVPPSVRRHFDRTSRLPKRFVALGDSACSFNPIYGQGMSVAAMEAKLLGERLRSRSLDDDRFTRSYYRRAAKVLDVPWSIGAGGDFQWAGTTGDRPRGISLLNGYVGRLQRAGHKQGSVADTFFQVQQLTARPQALMRPSMIWNAVRHGGLPS